MYGGADDDGVKDVSYSKEGGAEETENRSKGQGERWKKIYG